jgi:hypothetical protein
MHGNRSPVVLLRGVRKVYRSAGRTVEALAGVDLTVPSRLLKSRSFQAFGTINSVLL